MLLLGLTASPGAAISRARIKGEGEHVADPDRRRPGAGAVALMVLAAPATTTRP